MLPTLHVVTLARKPATSSVRAEDGAAVALNGIVIAPLSCQ